MLIFAVVSYSVDNIINRRTDMYVSTTLMGPTRRLGPHRYGFDPVHGCLLNATMVKSTHREGRKRSAWGWNAKCPPGGKILTFVPKPLPNRDITFPVWTPKGTTKHRRCKELLLPVLRLLYVTVVVIATTITYSSCRCRNNETRRAESTTTKYLYDL